MAPRDTSPSASKGKEKARRNADDEEEDVGGAGGGGSGWLRSMAQVTPQALASVVAGSGKATTGRSTTRHALAADDVQRAATAYSTAGVSTGQGQTSMRTGAPSATHDVDTYQHFAAQSRQGTLARRFDGTSSPAYVGTFASASELDAPLHEYVRAATAGLQDVSLDAAWDEATSAMGGAGGHEELHDPAYHDAWTRTIPAPSFPPRVRMDALPAMEDVGGSDGVDFMSALGADEEEEIARDADVLTDRWHAPSPTRPPTMTAEQAALHRALAEEQDGERRADERIAPPDDDAEARTGVYASTPEGALRAIWSATDEGARASQHVRDERSTRSTDGADVVRRVRRILARSSYVTDVYGVPEELEATMRDAEEEPTEANVERRARAIARLNALYKHLDGGATDVNSFVRGW